jgi:drug/metabolite transporter (DMT)-like permease
MTNSWLSIMILVLLVGIEFIADIFLKKWTLHQIGNLTLVPIFIIFICSFFLWMWAMKIESFSKVVNYYALLGIVGGSVLGLLFFQEKLSFLNIAGIILALVSIILISR